MYLILMIKHDETPETISLLVANSGWLNPFQKLPEHLQQGTQFARNALTCNLSLMIMMKNRYKSRTAVQTTANCCDCIIGKK